MIGKIRRVTSNRQWDQPHCLFLLADSSVVAGELHHALLPADVLDPVLRHRQGGVPSLPLAPDVEVGAVELADVLRAAASSGAGVGPLSCGPDVGVVLSRFLFH